MFFNPDIPERKCILLQLGRLERDSRAFFTVKDADCKII